MGALILARNVRRLRIARGLSQRGLAEAAGLSRGAITSLERAKTQPRMRTVEAIAKALGVRVRELLVAVRELRTVRFRSAKRMQYRENILAEVSRWLQNFNYLEEILDDRIPFVLARVRRRCSVGGAGQAAELCRSQLGLSPVEPIFDICGLLEKAGVKAHQLISASDGFFGLSVGEEDGGPAIIVNVWERIPVERRIFSAAHELGHLILHPDAYDVSLTQEEKEQERQADMFAAHFLMPDEGFRKEWDEAAGLHWVERVFKVKSIFRVSYKTVLFRLIEQQVADSSIWVRFQQAYQTRFSRKLPFKKEPIPMSAYEPFRLNDFDFYEGRFSRLVREGLEKDKISLSRAAELLGISVQDMQDLLQSWAAVP